ncbi:MAG: TfoX/Sxy family DNA transformation protein [Planctomycetes bacterium]|nr:TfoX/Sxy family DNA transformation protein [Planctomycetota bacterium]
MDDSLEYVLGQLAGLGEVRARRMFGGVGLYAEELFFGLIAGGVLFLKVDDATRPDYEARGSEPFRPYGDERAMRGYYELPSEVLEKPREAVRWAQRALEVARAAPAKAKKRRGRAKPAADARDLPLAKLKNLGPKSVAWLAEVGLRTRADLERAGSLGAYRAVRARRGEASLNLLYALEAALLDVHWTDLPAPLKERLRDAARK